MLSEARSSCAVMSSKESLEASGRPWLLPARSVEAGDTRVLLLALPPLLPPPPRLTGALWWPLTSPGRVSRMEPPLGLPMVLSSCSMEHRSAMRASRSTGSPWFSASAETDGHVRHPGAGNRPAPFTQSDKNRRATLHKTHNVRSGSPGPVPWAVKGWG